jgi:hypothetical protein
VGRQRILWKAVAGVAGTLSGIAARTLVLRLWRVSSAGDDAPEPADPRTPWRQALGWAVASGVAVGVARVVALRTAATVWERAADEPAPVAASAG